jgi:DnaJ-class molecular chaperone
VKPSSCPDCSGIGRVQWESYYRDWLMGSETVDRGPCEACEGTGVCPPVKHEECGGHLQFPHRGVAECADCGADVRLADIQIPTLA